MQIAVNIPDELAATIQARGLKIESYVEELVAEQAATLRGYGAHGELTRQEFDACLDAMARYSDKVPLLPNEAFSRESLYSDHD